MAGVGVFLLLLPPSLIAQAHTRFTFKQFNTSTLEFFGSASVKSKAISLNRKTRLSIGRAFYRQPVRMKDGGSLNSALSFSTSFVFKIRNPNSCSGHGLAFIMTPHKSPDGFLSAQYLGLIRNISSLGKPSNHLFPVEFETSQNVEFADIDGNHVVVNLNGLTSVKSESAGYWINKTQLHYLDLDDGLNIQAWIDCGHHLDELKVTIANADACSNRPEKPLIDLKNMSLSNILEEEMYVGFSAATGNLVEENYIVPWSFTTEGEASLKNLELCDLITLRKSKSSNFRLIAGIITACVVVLLVVVAASLAQ